MSKKVDSKLVEHATKALPPPSNFDVQHISDDIKWQDTENRINNPCGFVRLGDRLWEIDKIATEALLTYYDDKPDGELEHGKYTLPVFDIDEGEAKFTTTTSGPSTVSMCIFDAVKRYMEICGIGSLTNADREYFRNHKYARPGGVTSAHVLSVVQGLVMPWDVGISDVWLPIGSTVSDEHKAFMTALLINPLAAIDHETTNSQFLEQMDGEGNNEWASIEEINKIFRFRFEEMPPKMAVVMWESGFSKTKPSATGSAVIGYTQVYNQQWSQQATQPVAYTGSGHAEFFGPRDSVNKASNWGIAIRLARSPEYHDRKAISEYETDEYAARTPVQTLATQGSKFRGLTLKEIEAKFRKPAKTWQSSAPAGSHKPATTNGQTGTSITPDFSSAPITAPNLLIENKEGKVIVSWTAASGPITKYVVEASSSREFTDKWIAYTGYTTSIMVTRINTGKFYRVRGEGTNDKYGPWSNVVFLGPVGSDGLDYTEPIADDADDNSVASHATPLKKKINIACPMCGDESIVVDMGEGKLYCSRAACPYWEILGTDEDARASKYHGVLEAVEPDAWFALTNDPDGTITIGVQALIEGRCPFCGTEMDATFTKCALDCGYDVDILSMSKYFYCLNHKDEALFMFSDPGMKKNARYICPICADIGGITPFDFFSSAGDVGEVGSRPITDKWMD